MPTTFSNITHRGPPLNRHSTLRKPPESIQLVSLMSLLLGSHAGTKLDAFTYIRPHEGRVNDWLARPGALEHPFHCQFSDGLQAVPAGAVLSAWSLFLRLDDDGLFLFGGQRHFW